MCLDPDVFPPLAGFPFCAILGVFHHVLSDFLYEFLQLLTVFLNLFIVSHVAGSRVRTWTRVS
jgi:hypothetical protein